MSVLTLDSIVAREEAARYLDHLSDRGGAKNCVPQTLSGLPVAEARSVMEMEEVLVKRRALGARISSSDANASFFGATFSTMASIAASTPPRPPFGRPVEALECSSASSSEKAPCLTGVRGHLGRRAEPFGEPRPSGRRRRLMAGLGGELDDA